MSPVKSLAPLWSVPTSCNSSNPKETFAASSKFLRICSDSDLAWSNKLIGIFQNEACIICDIISKNPIMFTNF